MEKLKQSTRTNQTNMERFIHSVTHTTIHNQFNITETLNYRIRTETTDIYSSYSLLIELFQYVEHSQVNKIYFIKRICLLIVHILESNDSLYYSKLKQMMNIFDICIQKWSIQLTNRIDENKQLKQTLINQYQYYLLYVYNKLITTNSLIRQITAQLSQKIYNSNMKQYLKKLRLYISQNLQQVEHQDYFKVNLAIQFCYFNANWIKLLKINKKGVIQVKHVQIYFCNTLKSLNYLFRLIRKFKYHGLSNNIQKLKKLIKYITQSYCPYLPNLKFVKALNHLRQLYDPLYDPVTKYIGIYKLLSLTNSYKNAWIKFNDKHLQNKNKIIKRVESYSRHVKESQTIKKQRRLRNIHEDQKNYQKLQIRQLKQGRSKTFSIKRKKSVNQSIDSFYDLTFLSKLNFKEVEIKHKNNSRPRRVQSAKQIPRSTNLNVVKGLKQVQPEHYIHKNSNYLNTKKGIKLQDNKKKLYLSIRK